MNKKTELTDIIDKFFQNIPEKYLDFIKNSDIADEGKIGYKEWLTNRQNIIDDYKKTLKDPAEYKDSDEVSFIYLGLQDLFNVHHQNYMLTSEFPNYMFYAQQRDIKFLQTQYPNYQDKKNEDYISYQDKLLRLYLKEHKTHIKYKTIYECCKFDTTTASKKDIQIMRNGIMGCSEDILKNKLNITDLSDFDSFFVQKLSNLQAAIKDMHKDGYFLAMIQNNDIYWNKDIPQDKYLNRDIIFMLLNPDELIGCYELEKNKKPLVGGEYKYGDSTQRVESWLDKNKTFLLQIERRSVSQNTNIAKDKPRPTSADNLKLPSIGSAKNDKKKNPFLNKL